VQRNTPDSTSHDSIDVIRDQWRDIRPDLDTTVIDTIGRLLRAATLIVHTTDAMLVQHGLNRGEFEILAALRRVGEPQTPSELTMVSLASAPATTKRIRSLADRGLVRRTANPRDGRGAFVALTRRGTNLIDRVFPRMLDTERDLLAQIPPDAQPEVTAAMRRVVASVERASSRRAVERTISRVTQP
jgi:DNA-binding MarR family transcriptional regulator